jgi:hypothetical protein
MNMEPVLVRNDLNPSTALRTDRLRKAVERLERLERLERSAALILLKRLSPPKIAPGIRPPIRVKAGQTSIARIFSSLAP